MDNRKISVAIPTMNRPLMTCDSFKDVLNDERVNEVIVCDDGSTPENYRSLMNNLLNMNSPKIKLYKNERNLGVYAAKRAALEKITNEYGILFDSDNTLNTAFIDAIYSKEWNPKIILAPTFARPTFDYRAFAGITIDRTNVKQYINQHFCEAMFNTFNFAINREEYLRVWQPHDKVNVADSIYFNYLWFKAGNTFLPLAGMEYDHKVHPESNYILGVPNKDQVMPLDVKHLIEQL